MPVGSVGSANVPRILGGSWEHLFHIPFRYILQSTGSPSLTDRLLLDKPAARRLRTSGDSALRGPQLRLDLLSNGTSRTMHSDEPDQAVLLRRPARQAPRSSAPSPP